MYTNTGITYSNHASSKAKWIIWCVENQDGFTMIGSRKVRDLDLEVKMDYDDYGFFISQSASLNTPTKWTLTGSFTGFTMVVAKTELEALISLMNTFQQEEACEKAEFETYVKRLKEEKKREKLHKKAIRQAREGKFDAPKCVQPCYYCGLELDEAEREWQDEPYGCDEDDYGDYY